MRKLIGGGLLALTLGLALAGPAQAEPGCPEMGTRTSADAGIVYICERGQWHEGPYGYGQPSTVVDVWLQAIAANQPVPGEHAPGTNPLEVMAPQGRASGRPPSCGSPAPSPPLRRPRRSAGGARSSSPAVTMRWSTGSSSVSGVV